MSSRCCFIDRDCHATCRAYTDGLEHKCYFIEAAVTVGSVVKLGSQLVRVLTNKEADRQRNQEAPEAR